MSTLEYEKFLPLFPQSRKKNAEKKPYISSIRTIVLIFSLLLFYGRSWSQVDVTSTGGISPLSYTTLKDAFDAINAGTHTGSIAITITASTNEGANTAALNASGTGSASYTTVSIQPSGGSWTITGATTAGNPLINLNGADNVTIDGLNSGGNALIISNTTVSATAGTSTIRFINDASNDTVMNCNVQGSGTLATSGTILFSTSSGLGGNDGNYINNCNIGPAGVNLPVNAIYSLGSVSPNENSGNTISTNNIFNYFNAGLSTSGILVAATGNTGWTVTGNRLYQTATRTYTTTALTHYGINILGGSGYTVSSNIIGYAANNGTGTTSMMGSGPVIAGTFPTGYTFTTNPNAQRYIGINGTFATGGAASEIQGNTIGGLALLTSDGTSTVNGNLCGISVNGGNANVGTTTGNTIGSVTGNGSIYVANTSATGTIVGIYATTASGNTVSIQNNTIGGIDAMGISTAAAGTTIGSVTGIDVAGTGNFTISGNTIGNTTADNIRTGNLINGSTQLSNAGTNFLQTSAGGQLSLIRDK